ncbi:MBL fold metallo-hydrolase [Chloroflexota bacterium]
MDIRITTVSENTAGMGSLLGEWGLSILVEADGANVLLDTGMDISACYNVDRLDIDLDKINKIVLSHGHYDHTGGLRPLLMKMRRKVEIIAHPDVWAAKYARREGKPDRYIGIPFQRRELESLGAVFNLTASPVLITGNVMTTGEVPMTTGYEQVDSYLYIKDGNTWKPDSFPDDQALIINTEEGLVVVLGCAHRGAINTLYHAQKLTGVKSIHTVIGGSHLIDTTEERLEATIAALKDLKVQRLGFCHCTSLPVITWMAHEFGDSFFFNVAGTVVELP